MKITFKDLENFTITAKSKTLSEASEKLEMAQPSLSLGIKKLEKELGFSLFIRSKNGLKLTPQGKNLLPEAQEALRSLKKIKGQATNLKFKIGCHPSIGMFILGKFLRLMHKDIGSIDFEIINSSSNEVNRMVAQGEIDFGIVMNPLTFQGLIIKSIGLDTVYAWESKNRYQDKVIFNPQMLQSHSILSRWKLAPKDTIEVPNLELIGHLTQSGAGFGILPSQVVKAQKLNLSIINDAPTFKDRLALVCYPEMIQSKEGRLIFDNLKRSFTS